VTRALWLAPLFLSLGACSGKGNTGRKDIDPALIAQVPWINGAPPQICPADAATTPDALKPYCPATQAGQAAMPPSPMFPPIGSSSVESRVRFDDEGQRAQACAATDGIQLSSWHLDFEPYGAASVGVAPFFAVYDDKTEGSWHTQEDEAN
jgi:hypothetical protein